MAKKQIATGVAHEVPNDLYKSLVNDAAALKQWEDLTPLSRNEWICWTITVKQQKTRDEHVARTISQLKQGKRRPCCWVGCVHRTDKAINATQKWILEKQNKA